jgi:hypothetical protein
MTAIIATHRLEVRLHPHEVVKISHAQPNTSVQCREGILWITCSGDRTQKDCPDIVLSAGEHYTPAKNGRVVIEAMCDASLKLSQEQAPRGLRLFSMVPG